MQVSGNFFPCNIARTPLPPVADGDTEDTPPVIMGITTNTPCREDSGSGGQQY